MNKLIRTASLATTAVALAVSTGPAAAAPVSASTDATAHARILRPLTLKSTQNFDLGDIVLSGAAPFSATVSLSSAGVLTCPATVTCSGTTSVAKYQATGTIGQSISVSAPNVTLNGSNGGSLTLTTTGFYATSVPLGATGTVTFPIGGSITVTDTTTDGVYTGNFAVTADYQ